jgi:hypothetical protein
MSVPEIGFRATQYWQKRQERKSQQGYFPRNATLRYPTKAILPVGEIDLQAEEQMITVFGQSFYYNRPIDWHLDISSKRRFPKTFAKDINIRTSEYGSAKHVWEVNRLQFLPLLALQYRQEKDPELLNQFQRVVESWIEENPYLVGVNWYSNIEVNIRLIVWFFCWEILDVNSLMDNSENFCRFVESKWLPTIYLHCRYSYQNPSYYSSANNHLISEYAGLFIATSFWNFSESEKWLSHAKAGLEKEIIIQHSAKGVNKEEAAEYIQFITDFFLIPYVVAENTNNHFTETYQNQLKNILEYIYQMMDIQGNIPYYGDEDDGKVILLENGHVDNFKSLLTSGVVLFGEPRWKNKCTMWDNKNAVLFGEEGEKAFKNIQPVAVEQTSRLYSEEGHFYLRKQQGEREIYLHMDAAPLGFLSIAAHGHADALAFDLHVDGCPIITDSGTYTYHTDPKWRSYFIGTIAHNTIRINRTDQAQSTGPTMWINHYHVKVISSETTDTQDKIVAEHNGYLKTGVKHQRTLVFNKTTGLITITDDLLVKSSQEYFLEFPLHLHPTVKVEKTDEHRFMLLHNQARKVEVQVDSVLSTKEIRGQTDPILGWYSPSFQIKEPTSVLYSTIHFSSSIQLITNILVLPNNS